QIGLWYLLTRRSLLVELGDDYNELTDVVWTTSPDIGGGKDHRAPALACPEPLRAGGWKKQVEEHDFILEIDNKSITNRPDLWGHRGVAREIAALLDMPLKPLDLSHVVVHETPLRLSGSSDSASYGGLAHQMAFTIKNSEPTLCKRFTGMSINSVTYTPTLITHLFRLARVDVKPINAIVDATNYVMFDIGQPMHAFDLATIPSKTIMPRRARAGEKLTLLDGQNITLQPTDLVIADDARPLSLAGIMGGSATGITPHTHAVFVEAACFDPTTIRHSSSAHKLRTDASARFEKNLDPEQTSIALKRFIKVLQDAHIPMDGISDIVSLGAASHPLVIHLDHQLLEDRLGITITSARVVAILERLGFVIRMHDSVYEITVPSWRATKDITIKEDIIEEVARFFGYTNIVPVLPYKQTQPHDLTRVYRVRRIKQHLAYGLSFHEVSTYALYDEQFLRILRWEPAETAVVKNPVSEHWRRLVTSLMPHLFKAVATNSTEHDELRFFEWGRTWRVAAPIEEQKALAGIIFSKQKQVDFYQAKAELTSLFDMLALPVEWRKVNKPEHPWFMPYQTAQLIHNNQPIGFAGKVHPLFLQTLTEGDAFIFEINGDVLLEYIQPTMRFVPQSKYPAVVRDVSMLVPLRRTADELRACITDIDPTIVDVQLVDFFEKDTWKDQRSYTFRFVIQNEYKTLTKTDIDALYDRVVAALHERGATVR
ncbi:MAG: phenylalanine--tRNA ligase subunit beta, partial [Candidatus Babeliales bacterium]